MSYLVLARKWRPQSFDDVIGQRHVVTTLKNAISMDRVAHAYLLSGPRGVGKTSMARIFSKALNCRKGPAPDPCNACDACQEISAGNSLDVLEIDGATNRGIDQVRELRDNVKFSPASYRFKIYIIDEVHMLSTEAFNALLKTLEEPPAHVKFFFATTEMHKVPMTVQSRCQRFELRKISTKEIVSCLEKIVQAEKITADDKTLFALAREADGSLRDAQCLLDQLISFSAGELKYEGAMDIMGWVGRDVVLKFVSFLREGEWGPLFQLIHDADFEGKDLGIFVSELASYLRDLLILNVSPAGDDLVELPGQELAEAAGQAASLGKDQILQMLQLALETQDRLKFAISKRAAIEALAVRMHMISRSVSLDQVLYRLESISGGKSAGRAPAAAEPRTVKKKPGPDPLTQVSGADPWENVLQVFSQKKPLLHAYIKEAVPVWEDRCLRLLFRSEKSFIVDVLQQSENRALLFEEVKTSYGGEPVLEIGLLPSQEPSVPAVAAGDPAGPFARDIPPIQDNPVIQRALEIFGGAITQIKGGGGAQDAIGG